MGSVSKSSNNIFQMPPWRTTKLMRCVKVHDSNPTPQPPTFETPPSSDRPLIGRLGNNLPLPDRKLRQFDDGVDAVRQKLTLDFTIATSKMKSDILRAKDAPEKPWNLRVRKKCPSSDRAVVKPKAAARNSLPRLLRSSGDAAVSEGGGAATASTNSGLKKKFSMSLSKEEIEEDFMAMTGHKLPRRPKRNPRSLQKVLDPLFPGQWLAEIDVDTYKVPDHAGN